MFQIPSGPILAKMKNDFHPNQPINTQNANDLRSHGSPNPLATEENGLLQSPGQNRLLPSIATRPAQTASPSILQVPSSIDKAALAAFSSVQTTSEPLKLQNPRTATNVDQQVHTERRKREMQLVAT